MKRIIEDSEAVGLEALLGENVLLMCANYFYTGKLTGVNATRVELTDPAIVYETGPFTDKNYKDVQKFHAKVWYIQVAAIESYGVSK